jgi:3-isopropylmalate/(R)-2-methylmalate dehydratase large subunit
MGQTLSQKIIAKHSGKSSVSPGDLVMAKVDLALGNDITSPPAIAEFRKLGAKKVFDRKKIALVPDHFTPNKDIKSAEQVKQMREFSKEFGIVNFFEIGCMGVEHALLPELGMVTAGDLIIGADSHTCTYGGIGAFSTGVGSTDLAAVMATGEIWLRVPEAIKFVFEGKRRKWVEAKDLILYLIGKIGVDGARYKSMEFFGKAISELSVEGRLTMANMAIEAGGKNGIFRADAKTLAYLKKTKAKAPKVMTADPDAEYSQTFTYDCADIEPQVSFPHLPSNTKPVSKCGKVKIDQAVIGSCTNGRIEDLRVAAKVLKGKKRHPNVRLLILPATQAIYEQAMKEGLFDIFLKAEAAISTPTCGPCLGGHMGILAKGEKAIATTNRNFIGRMGSPESEVYLSNVAVAAASAVAGQIASPEDL